MIRTSQQSSTSSTPMQTGTSDRTGLMQGLNHFGVYQQVSGIMESLENV